MNKGTLALLVLIAAGLGTLIQSGEAEVQNTLKCYQCIIQGTNESLCDGELKTCPNYQAFDRCMINKKRNQTTGEFILEKGCALAPCKFGEVVETALGFTEKCDLSRRDADCVTCCLGDGCNKRSFAIILQPNLTPLATFTVLAIVFQVFLSALTT